MIPSLISIKEDVIVFPDVAYKAKEQFASFGFMMILNGVIVDASAIQGPKFIFSKEAEVRVFSRVGEGMEEWFC